MPTISLNRHRFRNGFAVLLLLVTGCSGMPTTGPDFRDVIARSESAVVSITTPDGNAATAFALKDDGLVATTAHSIPQGATAVEVAVDNGSGTLQGHVIHRDEALDIALIEPAGSVQLTGLELAEGAPLPGTWIVALGNPFGLGITASVGIVGADPGSIAAETGLEELIQTDAAINPGNSGGPLLDRHGRVVGMATRSIGNAGSLGFAVPAARIQEAITRADPQNPAPENTP